MQTTITISEIKKTSSVLYNHLINIKLIKKLICLYQISNNESLRNGCLTPEVGSFREKDLIAYLLSNKKLNVNYNISNNKIEDVIINNKKISIKHSSNKIICKNGIKIIWSVNKIKQNEFIKKFIFTCDLLIIFIRFDNNINNGNIEIIYITKEILSKQHFLSLIRKESIFNCLNGNSRGIEFSTKFFSTIISNCEFHIKIKFTNIININFDPILKRLKMLKVF